VSPIETALAWARRGWTVTSYSVASMLTHELVGDDDRADVMLDLEPTTDLGAIADHFGAHDGEAFPAVLLGDDHIAILGLVEREGPWTHCKTLAWGDHHFGIWIFKHPGVRLADVDGVIIAQDAGDVIPLPSGHLGNDSGTLDYLYRADPAPVPAEMLRVPA
jgi:hypothetical protein